MGFVLHGVGNLVALESNGSSVSFPVLFYFSSLPPPKVRGLLTYLGVRWEGGNQGKVIMMIGQGLR